MRIARVMAVKIVFNRTRIACADSRAVEYDHVVTLTMDNPRKRVSSCGVGSDSPLVLLR